LANLNGNGRLRFDSLTRWIEVKLGGFVKFTKKCLPWVLLSGVKKDEADIAWYARNINVSAAWQDKKTFFTIGA
jgi:hypothetical protein